MPQIHATGTHETYTRAERAVVTARISIASADRGQSITEASELHNRIAARAQQLRERGEATWYAAEAPSTWARKSYQEGEAAKVIIEHVTTSIVRLKLSNLTLVGPLVEEFSNMGAETDVSWALTEATKRSREREARKAAVGAAREVAEDYAEALGERIVSVISISDSPQGFGFGEPVMRSAIADYVVGGAEVSVSEISVSASVQGVFESE